jgi:hypothetical protein
MSLRMSSLVLLLLASLMFFVRPAKADSLSVVYYINLNGGSGDNAASLISGPGTLMFTGGGTVCGGYCTPGSFAPGTTLNASIPLLDFGNSAIGVFRGANIDPNSTFSVGGTSLVAGSFTFPSFQNGVYFTVTVPASMGTIHIFTQTQTFPFQVAPGQLRLTFEFDSGRYYFDNAQYTSAAVVTPEPQTLVLFGSGLLGITAASFRKFRQRGRHFI